MLLKARSFACIQGLPLLSPHTKECHTKRTHVSGSCRFTISEIFHASVGTKNIWFWIWFRCKTKTQLSAQKVVSRVTVDILNRRIPGYQAADETRQHKEPSTVKTALQTEASAKTLSWDACRSTFNTTGTEIRGTLIPHVAQLRMFLFISSSTKKKENKSAFGENNS